MTRSCASRGWAPDGELLVIAVAHSVAIFESRQLYSFLVGGFGVETVEVLARNVRDNGEEFLLGILIFVTSAGNSDADSSGDVTDTVQPDGSVKGGIDSHVLTSNKLI